MSKELIERLRNDSYALPSDGEWIERNGDTMPNNSCSQAADALEEAYRTIEAQRTLYSNCTEIARKLEIAQEALEKIGEYYQFGMYKEHRVLIKEALAQLGDKCAG